MTTAERERLGKEGAALIERNIRGQYQSGCLRDEDQDVHELIIPSFKEIQPKDRLQQASIARSIMSSRTSGRGARGAKF
jgi:hypothetical protein